MAQAAIKSSKWKTPKHVAQRALTLAESADIYLCAKQKVGRDMQTFGLIMSIKTGTDTRFLFALVGFRLFPSHSTHNRATF
jgi:hypothetical protein